MAISVKRAHSLAEEGELPVDEVLKTLYESENVQGCRLVSKLGHPLQHTAVLLYPVVSRKDKSSKMARSMYDTAQGQSGITPLEEKYWKRGPGNQGIKYHSQFATDEQAGVLIRNALCGEGGVQALRYLGIKNEITVCLATYLRGSYQTIRRLGNLNDPNIFTQVPETSSLIVVVLHSRYGTLHIQTAYPTRAKQRRDDFNLNPTIGWELEVTDRATGESDLVRPHRIPW
jgi:hypothetical protein